MTPVLLDSAKYGLPVGPGAPTYTYQKWPASVAIGHFRAVCKALGRHVADLFAAGAQVEGDFAQRVSKATAAGYLGDLVEAGEIRDPESLGYCLSPAVVPVHDPALITTLPSVRCMISLKSIFLSPFSSTVL